MAWNQSSSDSQLIETKIERTKRGAPPAHYILKIKSFSKLLEILSETGNDKYESEEFEAAGFKWKLILYPNGNEKGNGKGHISMYVRGLRAFSSECHVNALVNLFVYDHIRDEYLTIQDGEIKRFHVLKKEHGFDELLSLVDFYEISNGYLVDDCCAFGAEVHVIQNTVKVNELIVIKAPPKATCTWKIDKFSKLRIYCSGTFNVGGYKWVLHLNPKELSKEREGWLSLYLILDNAEAINGQGVFAEYVIFIKDHLRGELHGKKGNHEFGRMSRSSGFPHFKMLSDVRNPSNGYLVNDTLFVEARITRLSYVQDLA